MAKKVLIFQDLLLQYASLSSACAGMNMEVVPADSGKDALEKSRDPGVIAVLIDAAMPQMSGIEVCRQIKDGAIGTAPKIMLISSIESPTLKQRVLDAGCDRYIDANEGEAPILHFLSVTNEESPPTPENAGADPAVESPSLVADHAGAVQRVAERVEVPGPVTYYDEGVEVPEGGRPQELPGYSINVSSAGILVAVDESVPKGATVRLFFQKTDGERFDLRGHVVRIAKLKEPKEGFAVAVGVKFLELDEFQKDNLDLLIRSQPPPLPKLKPETVRTLFDRPDETIRAILGGAESELSPIFVDLTPVERNAFSSEYPFSLLVQRLAKLRILCKSYRAFLPTLVANKGGLSGPFLPYLIDMMTEATALDDEVVAMSRSLANESNDDARLQLIDVSNAVYEEKVQLIFAVDEKLQPEGVTAGKEVILQVKEEAEKLRELRQGQVEDVRYQRRSLLKEKEEEKKKLSEEKQKSKKGEKSNKPAIIAISVVVFIFVILAIVNLIQSRVSQTDLKIAIEIKDASKDDTSLTIAIDRKAWSTLPEVEQEEIFNKVEAYLRAENLRQAKVLDESGRYIAAIMYGRVGRNIVFQRKVF